MRGLFLRRPAQSLSELECRELCRPVAHVNVRDGGESGDAPGCGPGHTGFESRPSLSVTSLGGTAAGIPSSPTGLVDDAVEYPDAPPSVDASCPSHIKGVEEDRADGRHSRAASGDATPARVTPAADIGSAAAGLSSFPGEDRPPLTEPQKRRLRELGERYDVVGPHKVRRNGWCEVRVETYDGDGRTVNWIDVAPDGSGYDIGEERG